MEDFIQSWIYSVLVSGCICSVLLFFGTDSKIKPLLETGCACIMILTFISPLNTVSIQENMNAFLEPWDETAPTYQDYHTQTQAYIEKEYRTYILNEANRFGVTLSDVKVTTIRDDNDNWIPYEVYLITDHTIYPSLKEHLCIQLGIPKERQYVNDSNTME